MVMHKSPVHGARFLVRLKKNDQTRVKSNKTISSWFSKAESDPNPTFCATAFGINLTHKKPARDWTILHAFRRRPVLNVLLRGVSSWITAPEHSREMEHQGNELAVPSKASGRGLTVFFFRGLQGPSPGHGWQSAELISAPHRTSILISVARGRVTTQLHFY